MYIYICMHTRINTIPQYWWIPVLVVAFPTKPVTCNMEAMEVQLSRLSQETSRETSRPTLDVRWDLPGRIGGWQWMEFQHIL